MGIDGRKQEAKEDCSKEIRQIEKELSWGRLLIIFSLLLKITIDAPLQNENEWVK